jgi:hypothetical protein
MKTMFRLCRAHRVSHSIDTQFVQRDPFSKQLSCERMNFEKRNAFR